MIWKYILTCMTKQGTRTAVMLLSILLSAVLLFVSFSIGSSYESAQRKMARGKAGSATVSVTATGAGNRISLEELPDVSSIGASVGMLMGDALYHGNGYYETIDLIAADLQQLDKINKPRLLDGGEPADFSGHSIILPDRFTSKYGIKKGDEITLQVEGKPVRFEVAGIAAYDTVFLRHTRGANALVPLSALREVLGQTEGFGEILIQPAAGVSTAELVQGLKEALPDRSSYRVSRIVNEAQLTADARQKSMPFFLISFFSLTISVFIIYSSYKVITLERLPVIGTLRSIGATRKAITRILLLESALYGSLGGLAGIPAGMLVLKLILQGMGKSLSQGIEIPVVISPLGTILSLVVAVAASLLSAWLPVRRASRLPIKEVVLGMVEEKRPTRPRSVILMGTALFLISWFLPRLATGQWLYVAGGLSLLGLIAATILIIPFLTNMISIMLESVYGAIFKNEGRLAARNMRDNKNIAQNITLLFISISATIAITVVGQFVTAYISDVFRDAELQGFADGTMRPGFVEQVKKMEGIRKILPLYVFGKEAQGNGIPFTRLEATDNLEWYSSMLGLRYSKGWMQEQAIASFKTDRSILLSEDGLKRTGFSVGDVIQISSGASVHPYAIVGSFKSRSTDVEAIIPAAFAASDFDLDTYSFLAYTANDPDAIMVQIRALFGDVSNWSRTVEEFNTDALTTVGAFLRPMHSMTYFILLLATVGVINNLLINYMQKRRIIAVYKSVGLSNGQNLKMTLLEGGTSGIVGAVIAVIISYMEIQTIFLVAGPKIAMAPKLSAATFLIAGGMGILVALLGSAVPILKSRRMSVIQEIKLES